MNITISSQIINDYQDINNKKKILIMGKASSSFKAREILHPKSKEDALSLYGESELYDAYCLLLDLGVTKNIYTSNCYSESDYIRLVDKLIHYDFDYLVPIGIYLSDKFYNPIDDIDEYYATYFLKQFSTVNSLTTILMTERHASLYEDFDSYLKAMSDIEFDFTSSYNLEKNSFLESYGNNLNFIYNNLEDIPYGNIVLGALYCLRNYSEYFSTLKNMSTVFNIDNIDVKGLRGMFFKFNYYTNSISIENAFNFKTTNDIYANALIDDVIKRTIREVDLSEYKGKMFNSYVSIQIKNDINKKLGELKGKLFKKFNVQKVMFKKTEPTAGYIIAKYSIVPFGTLEELDIVMGVI